MSPQASSQLRGGKLRTHGGLACEEGVLLGHGGFGAVEDVVRIVFDSMT